MEMQNRNKVKPGMVRDMRSIREQISREISGMSLEQERAYLDKLLSENKANAQRKIGLSGESVH